MKKIVLLLMFFVFGVSALFAQSNLKVIEYKILKFKKGDTKEYTIPKGQIWKIESVLAYDGMKVEFTIDDDLYLFFWHEHTGVTDEFIPFYLPENTKFKMKPADKMVISVAVLKID